MASEPYVKTLLNRLPADLRAIFTPVFEEVLRNLRLLAAEDNRKSENFQSYRFQGTTHGTANTEFSIVHGQGQAPLALIPILPLDAVNAQLVDLTVTRAADVQRIYLSSPSTGATFFVQAEF